MNVGENIRRLRLARGLSQGQLGEFAGVSDKAVSTWERGHKLPRMAAMQRLADYFQVRVSDLFDADAPDSLPVAATAPRLADASRTLSASDASSLAAAFARAARPVQLAVCRQLGIEPIAPQEQGRMVEMIVYDDPSGAGSPLYAESDYERICFPESQLPRGADFGVRIRGDSMTPTIQDGQIVWVRKQDSLHDQEIGIFTLEGGASVCKRLSLPQFSHHPRLLSDNPAHAPISGESLAGLRVVGKVLF